MPRKKLVNSTQKEKNIAEAFSEYIKYCKVRNLSKATIEYYKMSFNSFCKFHDDNKIQSISEGLLFDYILYLKENTNNNEISIQTLIRGLRTILYYFMKLGYLKQFKIELPKAQKPPKETYTDEEINLLLKKPKIKEADFAEFRTWVVINFLLGTACRADTLVNIKIEDIDFEGGFILFRKTKNKTAQSVPLTSELSKVLTEYIKYRGGEPNDWLFPSIYGGKLTTDALGQSIQRYNRRRGVNRTSVHVFRHTFAKDWIMNGGDIFRLQKILGHKSLDMVKIYVNLFASDLHQDYDKFNPLSKYAQRSNGKKLKLNK